MLWLSVIYVATAAQADREQCSLQQTGHIRPLLNQRGFRANDYAASVKGRHKLANRATSLQKLNYNKDLTFIVSSEKESQSIRDK